MSDPPRFAPGARRVRRPAEVLPCTECGELAGRGYPGCFECAGLVDGFWLADWYSLLTECAVPAGGDRERELAERVLATEVGGYPWTCVDWAMSTIPCPACGAELGAGEVGCVLCRIADETRWAWRHGAPPGSITANEQALRTARTVLRAPHRHRATVILDCRLSLPFLLTGEAAGGARTRWIRAYLRAGRYEELAAAGSYTQLADTPNLPWR